MKARRFAALFAVVPLLVPLLVSCGGDDEPEPSGSASASDTSSESGAPSADADGGEGGGEGGGADACDLLTTDVVAEAVGSPVADGLPSGASVATGGTQTTCVWNLDGDGFATATLTVYSDRSAAESVFTEDSLPLPEVGNDAFIGSFSSVWGYAGDGSFMTQWYDISGSDEQNLAKSIALAQAYLAAL